ncbi:MAG: hypothetical protein ABIO24_07760, partial [Saprospiraceae bacterium]
MNYMNTCFVLLFFAFSVVSVTGQTIDIYPKDVRGLQTTFRLNGMVGKSTPTKSLQIMNRTRQAVQVFARPHVEEDALFFIDMQGTTRLEFSLTIAPGQGATLYMFGFLDQGDNLQCEGYVSLAITPIQKGGSNESAR